MAIAMIVEFNGVGIEKYNAVMKELKLDKPNAQWPKGVISHLAGPIPNGFQVVDVWESQATWDTFLTNQLIPAITRVGGIPKPSPRIIAIHNSHGLATPATR